MDWKDRKSPEYKEWQRKYAREHYLKNREKYIERAAKRQAEKPDEVKETKRKHRYEKIYGVSYDEAKKLRETANHCHICGALPPTEGRFRELFLDHDHVTGKIRGLLCPRCNSGIAAFGDNLEGIMRVVEYLKRSNPTPDGS